MAFVARQCRSLKMAGLWGTRANSLSSQLRKHSWSPDLISSMLVQCLPLACEGIQENRPSITKRSTEEKSRGKRAAVSLSGLAAEHPALERGQNVVKGQKER